MFWVSSLGFRGGAAAGSAAAEHSRAPQRCGCQVVSVGVIQAGLISAFLPLAFHLAFLPPLANGFTTIRERFNLFQGGTSNGVGGLKLGPF
jgi:hypothetical protein